MIIKDSYKFNIYFQIFSIHTMINSEKKYQVQTGPFQYCWKCSDEVHGFLHSPLQDLLDLDPLLLGELHTACTASAGAAPVSPGQVVVMLPSPLSHQVGVVGGGGVGDGPERVRRWSDTTWSLLELTWCSDCRGGRDSRRGSPARQRTGCCRPTAPGSDRAWRCPGSPRERPGRNHPRWDG